MYDIECHAATLCIWVLMNRVNHRCWKVLSWNVSGLNTYVRQHDIRAKIEESQSAIVFLQETKFSFFDQRFLTNLCPKRFDHFAYSTSIVNWWGLRFTNLVVSLHSKFPTSHDDNLHCNWDWQSLNHTEDLIKNWNASILLRNDRVTAAQWKRKIPE